MHYPRSNLRYALPLLKHLPHHFLIGREGLLDIAIPLQFAGKHMADCDSDYCRYFWAGWVMLGWGSGVLIHGLRVFEKIPFLSGNWERNQVEKYLGRKL